MPLSFESQNPTCTLVSDFIKTRNVLSAVVRAVMPQRLLVVRAMVPAPLAETAQRVAP